jgi:hypothetical protein
MLYFQCLLNVLLVRFPATAVSNGNVFFASSYHSIVALLHRRSAPGLFATGK